MVNQSMLTVNGGGRRDGRGRRCQWLVAIVERDALDRATRLKVRCRRVATVQQGYGTGRGERVQSIGECFVVQVVEGAIGLAGLVAGSVEHGPTNEFVFDGARTQATTLRLDLVAQWEG